MDQAFLDRLAADLADLRNQGLYKFERVLASPQAAVIRSGEREVVNLCANNYLGLANHPAIREAAHRALDRYGYGMASVRFICGTHAIHREPRSACRPSSVPRTRSSILPVSMRTAACSRAARRGGRGDPTRSTTRASSTASGSARRRVSVRQRRHERARGTPEGGRGRAHAADRDDGSRWTARLRRSPRIGALMVDDLHATGFMGAAAAARMSTAVCSRASISDGHARQGARRR